MALVLRSDRHADQCDLGGAADSCARASDAPDAVDLFSAAAMLLIAGLFCPRAPACLHATGRVDRTMPAWQFGEHHATRVRATPERVDAAIRKVTADDVALFRTLTSIRSPRLRRQDMDIMHRRRRCRPRRRDPPGLHVDFRPAHAGDLLMARVARG